MTDDPQSQTLDADEEVDLPRTFADPPPDGGETPEVHTFADLPPVDGVVQDFTFDYLSEVQAAEAAAQRSLCNMPEGDTPSELAQALERRVEVNLAQADGVTVTRVGSTDSEVRRLEAPFAKRRAAGSDEDDSHRRRSTTQPDSTRKEHR